MAIWLLIYDIVRKIRPPGELMRKDKLVEIDSTSSHMVDGVEGICEVKANQMNCVRSRNGVEMPAHC